MTAGSAPLSPNYRRRLAEYPRFQWASIGAVVVAQDNQGAVEVEWNMHRFDRTIDNKFDKDFIIFSRPQPEWTQQNKVYFTLIRFADYNPAALLPEAQREQPAAPQVSAAMSKSLGDTLGLPAGGRQRQAVSPRVETIRANGQVTADPADLTRSRSGPRPQGVPVAIFAPDRIVPPDDDKPFNPLEAQAGAVTDAASFYALATSLTAHDRKIGEKVRAVLHHAESSWGEKAAMLLAA
jgi:hypothetical protein